MVKTTERQEEIRQNWRMRNILRQIQQNLPEGYKTTNKRPVLKQVKHHQSASTCTYWSSWVRNGDEKFLALLDSQKGKLKLISEEDIKENYHVRSL